MSSDNLLLSHTKFHDTRENCSTTYLHFTNDRHMYNYDYYYIYKAWITLSDFSEHVDMISMDTPPLAQSASFFFFLVRIGVDWGSNI